MTLIKRVCMDECVYVYWLLHLSVYLLLWLALVLLVICCHWIHVIYGAVQICTNVVTGTVPGREERN